MKRALLLLLFAVPALIVQAQQTKSQKGDPKPDIIIEEPVSIANPSKSTLSDTNKIFTSVEQIPEFPGGPQAFYRYIVVNIRYPMKAVEQKKQGRVFVGFVVEKNGSLSSIKVLRGVSAEIDTEALRVIRKSPKWKPALMNGNPVRVMYTMPISFQLPLNLQPDSLKIYTSSEEVPSFPGGEEKFSDYLKANLKYPEAAKKNGVQGKVFVTMIVEKDGSLTSIKVIRGIGSGCDEEAIRLLEDSPKWNPGMQTGHPVRVYYTIPIDFRL